MQYTNAQILSAVLSNFLEPLVNPIITQLANNGIGNMPAVRMIENKIKSWGIVNPNWTLANELTPFTDIVFGKVISPMINKYVSQLPDEAIPKMAHGIVDKAISNGEMSILDGYITLDIDDLKRLKNLLNWNLPLDNTEEYTVITSETE